ncbi:hypothetical protein TNCV_1512771 [Trichonephila clavipes]|nr:hypothetical protein TNCV_1512771 [Trichonephila clavipes]
MKGVTKEWTAVKTGVSLLEIVVKKMLSVESVCLWESEKNVKATQGLFDDGPRNFEHGQMTRTANELEPPSPNYHTTPTRARLSSRQI